MNTMDLKEIAWVGNIYQRFEAMCVEVEETVYQGTAKYVDNQMQTVGASLKKFYSDVMQDLVPPSSTDPVKAAAADSFLNSYADVGIHKKPKSSIKEDTPKVDKILTEGFGAADRLSSSNEVHNLNGVLPSYSGSNICFKGISKKDNHPPSEKSSSDNPLSKDWSRASSVCEISEEAAHDQIAMILSQASVEIIGCHTREEGENGNDILDATVSIDDDSTESPTSDVILSVDSSGKKGRMLRRISSSDSLSAESIDACSNNGLVSEIGSYISDETQYSESEGEETFMSYTGRSGDCNTDVIENNDATKPRMENIEQDEKSKLEETCVLVDGDELCVVPHGEELCVVPHREGKHRSYKKKIREVLSLRIRSSRKHEYKQLAAQYEDTDTGSNLKSAESVMMPTLTTGSKKLQAHAFSESEWELL